MTTLAIFCGASQFPKHHGLTDNPAFAFSASRIRTLLQGAAEINNKNILYLVDSEKDVAQQVDDMAEFLERRKNISRAIFYYVGHGIFCGDNEYYLSLKITREKRELFSSLRVQSLAKVFEDFFPDGQILIILDCCFSGEAVASFMAPMDDLVVAKVSSAFPKGGTALLVAASKNEAAIVPTDASLTMFSEGFAHVLENGIPGAEYRLTLAQVGQAIRSYLQQKYGLRAVLPQVHSPRQQGVDVATVPAFSNAAISSRAVVTASATSRLTPHAYSV